MLGNVQCSSNVEAETIEPQTRTPSVQSLDEVQIWSGSISHKSKVPDNGVLLTVLFSQSCPVVH